MTRLDRETLLVGESDPTRGGHFDATVHPGWGTSRSPNGGYLMAMMLRGMITTVGDPARPPRSITTHFLRAAAHGPATLDVTIERIGGKLTTVSARMLQNDKTLALGLAAFGAPFGDGSFQDVVMPQALAPDQCPALPQSVDIDHRFEHRRALGPVPFSGGGEAYIGGWSRMEESRECDALLMVMLSDGWWPAIFTRLESPKQAGGTPTVDLTVHFRAPLPHPGSKPDDFYLVSMRTVSSREGYVDETGEVWAPDGTLLAVSRQHAVRV